MTPSEVTGGASGADGDFVLLVVAEVVRETAQARSFVFDIPEHLAAQFRYESGQFVTVRPTVDGTSVPRCYSMSSAPAVDDRMRITVKQVPGGPVSNWLADHVAPGDTLAVSRPGGRFVLRAGTSPVVAFAGGSGITPVLSIIKTVLATTERSAHLLYANRDAESVIFAAELAELAQRYPERLTVTHHLDADAGLLDGAQVRALAAPMPDAEFYVCGPEPFMAVVEAGLGTAGVAAARVHLERFTLTPVTIEPAPPGASPAELTVELSGKTKTGTVRPGHTLLMAARAAGVPAPSSCELGTCGTCMAKLVDGQVELKNNEVLEQWELDEGWILMCQAVPTTPTVRVAYE